MKPPLFVPLCGRWFDAFASGQKTVEYRRPQGTWTAKNCTVGRAVVLSRGYGKQKRITGKIVSYALVPAASIGDAADIYPDAETLAAIGIALDPEISAAA